VNRVIVCYTVCFGELFVYHEGGIEMCVLLPLFVIVTAIRHVTVKPEIFACPLFREFRNLKQILENNEP